MISVVLSEFSDYILTSSYWDTDSLEPLLDDCYLLINVHFSYINNLAIREIKMSAYMGSICTTSTPANDAFHY